MSSHSTDFDEEIRQAICHFWSTRTSQSQVQGTFSGVRDTGARSAVTGGAQLHGFADVIKEALNRIGISNTMIFHQKKMVLPGWYRAEKKWDLLIVADGILVAAVELKSQVGPSFGNNFNNRTEEAIGNATDFWAAYREGAFKPSTRPWLGYLMLLEHAIKSTNPVKVHQPHFSVFPEFKNASYAERYEILLTKLVRERLYDGACFLLSSRITGTKGDYSEPAEELSFRNFISSLLSKASSILSSR